MVGLPGCSKDCCWGLLRPSSLGCWAPMQGAERVGGSAVPSVFYRLALVLVLEVLVGCVKWKVALAVPE